MVCLLLRWKLYAAVALEGVTLGFLRRMCTGTVYLDRRGCTLAIIIIGTVVGFTVDLNPVTSTSAGIAVCHGTSGTFFETAAACFICSGSIFSGNVDVTFGTELFLIVHTGSCWTFQSCHDFSSLICIDSTAVIKSDRCGHKDRVPGNAKNMYKMKTEKYIKKK